MPKKLSDWDWLKKYATTLLTLGTRFNGAGESIKYGAYTVLKLICIRYYAGMFATIATGPSAKSRNYDGAVYVDLFAGPGSVTIAETRDRVVGSPLAATETDQGTKFDYEVFVESDSSRMMALERRMNKSSSKGKFKIVHGDCNNEIDEVIADVKKRFRKPILLAFIDPEGMEAKWKTIEKLSGEFPNLDFMINMNVGTSRVGGKVQRGYEGYRPIFDDFFGESAEQVLVEQSQGKPIEESYRDRIQNTLGRPVGATIPVYRTGGQIMYHILAYTRRSWTGSPWAGGFETLRERIPKYTGETVRKAIDVIKGRSPELGEYMTS